MLNRGDLMKNGKQFKVALFWGGIALLVGVLCLVMYLIPEEEKKKENTE